MTGLSTRLAWSVRTVSSGEMTSILDSPERSTISPLNPFAVTMTWNLFLVFFLWGWEGWYCHCIPLPGEMNDALVFESRLISPSSVLCQFWWGGWAISWIAMFETVPIFPTTLIQRTKVILSLWRSQYPLNPEAVPPHRFGLSLEFEFNLRLKWANGWDGSYSVLRSKLSVRSTFSQRRWVGDCFFAKVNELISSLHFFT